jgi:hypothetical protein
MIADSREPGMLSEAWLKANTVGDCLIGQEELVHQKFGAGETRNCSDMGERKGGWR